MKTELQHLHTQMHLVKEVQDAHPELADRLADVLHTLRELRMNMIKQSFDNDTLNTLGLRHEMLMFLCGKTPTDAAWEKQKPHSGDDNVKNKQ